MQLIKDDFAIFRPGYADQVAKGFRPRIDNDPVHLVLPLDWDMDPFHDRNWKFQLHAWRMLDPIWSELYGQDWNRLRNEILPWVRDWYAYHVVRGLEAAFTWYDMSAGYRAQHLALLTDLHRRGTMPLEASDFDLVRRLSEEHMSRLRNPAYIAMNNHGLFQLKGLRLLGAAWNGEPFCEGELDYTTQMMDRLLDSQFDERGVHVENSPDYHGFVLKQFSGIRPELFPGNAAKLDETLTKAREVLPWFTFPDRSVAAIGDSAGTSTPLPPKAHPDLVVETPAAGRLWVRDLSASGYVVVRSAHKADPARNTMLVVKGQTRSDGHAHADQLSMILYRAGQHLLTDSGKYSYNRDAWRNYFVSDRAHNVVGLIGHSFGPQDTSTTGPCLSGVGIDGNAVIVEGSVERRKFFKHRRRIIYRPEECIEIEDRIDAKAKAAPVAYWHLGAGVDAEKVNDGVELFHNGQRLARLSVSDSAIKARLVHGQEHPRIQGWLSPSYKQKIAATVIEFRAPGGCSRIDTRIELFKPKPLSEDTLPRRLCHGVTLRFEHKFVSDRVKVLEDGRTQREVAIKVPASSAPEAVKKLAAALVEKGFAAKERIVADGASIHSFRHEDRTQTELRVGGLQAAMVTLILSWQRLPLEVAATAQDNQLDAPKSS